jgi:tRNA 2-thiocytidine biosynthesis protein TtcA
MSDVTSASPASAAVAPPAAGVGAAASPPWAALVQSQRNKSKVGRKITRTMMQTIEAWRLVEPGDRIMVAISGGKDSYTLLDLLWQAKKKAPFSFDVVAVHLDQAQPGYDGAPLLAWLQAQDMPFEIVREDTYSIVKAGTKEGQAYCFLCSRLRRGILYTTADRLSCNKIALGHHRDDALETLLMNLCYAGKLQAMPARYTTDDGRHDVIRPLIDVAESDIRTFSAEQGYPILPCNLCGSQDGLKRDAMAALLGELEEKIPDVRAVMHHAIRNVRPTHLLDPEVASAWAARPAEIRPKEVVERGPARLTGEVVAKRAPRLIGGVLPIVSDGD